MKPLTIEQLKALEVDDWVWLEIKDKQSLYVKKCEARLEDGFNFIADFVVTVALYSDYGKTWLIDYIRILEQSNNDYEWQINNQVKNCEKLLANKDKQIQELQTKLSHCEEDLVHADEKVFYREVAVKLEEDKIKQQAVREFAGIFKKHIGYEIEREANHSKIKAYNKSLAGGGNKK